MVSKFLMLLVHIEKMHDLVALDLSNVGVPWCSDIPAYIYISLPTQPVHSRSKSRSSLAIKPVCSTAALIT